MTAYNPTPMIRRGELRAEMPWMSSYPNLAELENYLYPLSGQYNVMELSQHLWDLGVYTGWPLWQIDVEAEAERFRIRNTGRDVKNPFSTDALHASHGLLPIN